MQSNSNIGSIWTQSSGQLVEAYFSYCDLSQGGSAPSVAAFNLVDPNGGFNACVWEKCVCTMENPSTAYFFNWVSTNSENFSYGNVWRDVVFEQCAAGAIYALAHFGAVLDNVSLWDCNQLGAGSTSTADLIYFGRNASNLGSRGISIKNCMRSDSTLGTGKYDIAFDAWTQQVLIENYRATPDNAAINLGGLTGAQLVGLSVGVRVDGATPTVTAASCAGTSAPTPTVNAGPAGMYGSLTWGTGTSTQAGGQVAVTFGAPAAHLPAVTVGASNAAAAGLQLYVTNVTTTGFTIASAVAPASSQPNTAYSVNWQATCQ